MTIIMWLYRDNEKKDSDEKTQSEDKHEPLTAAQILKICNLLNLAGANQTTGTHDSEWFATQQAIRAVRIMFLPRQRLSAQKNKAANRRADPMQLPEVRTMMNQKWDPTRPRKPRKHFIAVINKDIEMTITSFFQSG